MDSETKLYLKKYVIEETDRLISEIDLLTETINFATDGNNGFKDKRDVIIKKLLEIQKEKMDDINKDKDINISIFLYDFQLYLFVFKNKKHNRLFDAACFNIIRKFIHSKDIIIYIDEIEIDNINDKQYKHLKEHEIFETLNIKSFTLEIKSGYEKVPKDINRLSLVNNHISRFISNYFTNLTHLNLFHNTLETFECDCNLIYLDVGCNYNLRSLKVKNTLEYIDISNTLIKDLSPYPLLKTIVWDGNVYQNKSLVDWMNGSQKRKYLKSLTLKGKKINGFGEIDTDNISDELEYLSIDTDLTITSKSLKSLDITCSECPNIDCRNITSLSINEYGNSYKDFLTCIRQCSLLTNLKLSFHKIDKKQFNINRLSYFENLTSLTIANVVLSEVVTLDGFNKLTELDLENVKTRNDNLPIFSKLSSLKKLSISGGNVKDKSFLNLNGLEELILKNPDNIVLNENTFSNLSSLEILKIYIHNFDSISENLFIKLSNLKQLHFESSSKVSIPINIFANLFSLSSLMIVTNYSCIPYNICFKGLYNLINLTIYGFFEPPYPQYINKDLFSDLSNLRSLVIYSTLAIDEDAFINLKNLRDLTLLDSSNSVTNSTLKHFKTLENVTLYNRHSVDYDMLLKNNPNIIMLS